MLVHTKSPGGNFTTLNQYVGNLVPEASFPTGIGVSVVTPGVIGFLSPVILGSTVFTDQLPPSVDINIIGRRMLDGRDWFDGIYMQWLLRIANIKHFLRGAPPSQAFDSAIERENNVVHVNLKGRTLDQSSPSAFLIPFLDIEEPEGQSVVGSDTLSVHVVSGDVVEIIEGDDVYDFPLDLCIGVHNGLFLDRMSSGHYDQSWAQTYYFPIEVSNGNVKFIVYRVDHSWWGDYRGTYTGYKISVTPQYSPTPLIAPNGTTDYLASVAADHTWVIQYSDVIQGTAYTGEANPATDAETRAFLSDITPSHFGFSLPNKRTVVPQRVALASLSDVVSSSTGSDLFDLIGYVPATGYFHGPTVESSVVFRRFDENSLTQLGSFVGGTYLSAVDALENFLFSVNSNFIESSSELGEILSPVDLVKALRTLRGHGKLETISNLLKLLSSANLAYKFGIAPTLDDAANIANSLQRTVQEIRGGIYRWQTAYGSALIDVPANTVQGFGACVIRVNTKVRLRVDSDSLFSSLFPLEQLGVLPSFARFWDLIPFSWLSDYIVDVGGIVELVDKQVLMLMVDVSYSVNSIRLSYDLSSHESDYGFIHIGENTPEYRMFARIVFPDTLPVLGPTSLPLFRTLSADLIKSRWDILGSIVVQQVL